MKNIRYIFIIAFTLLSVISCNEFLDETPDNRAELDSPSKIKKLLISAYPEGTPALAAELSTDNVIDDGEDIPYTYRLLDQMAMWEDITEEDNDDLKTVWEKAYSAISSSNAVLAAIEELGEEGLDAEKGEALITRAYSHFVLVNMFCRHYDPSTSSSDLGIPYMEASETTLNPKYDRGTVAGVYEKINADVEAALPLISDDLYDIPLYHFTSDAAYAFAARFNLYMGNWEKAEEYATKVLGSNPSSKIRDWTVLAGLPRNGDVAKTYVNESADLLALASSSNLGSIFGAYYSGSRFTHSAQVANETLKAPMPWSNTGIGYGYYVFRPFVYSATNLDKTLFYKIPYYFEYTDKTAGIGYRKTVCIPFTTDETLMVRAEAKIMQKKYDEALADLELWTGGFFNVSTTTTTADVDALYNSMEYETADKVSSKKKLNPIFAVEAGTQENMIHYLLQCRRILTLHEGLRWFDIKRYGIEVFRRQVQVDGSTIVTATLGVDDPRRALQIPPDVVSAGLTPNPR